MLKFQCVDDQHGKQFQKCNQHQKVKTSIGFQDRRQDSVELQKIVGSPLSKVFSVNTTYTIVIPRYFGAQMGSTHSHSEIVSSTFSLILIIFQI